MPAWETVWEDQIETTRRLPVPGGWIYAIRNIGSFEGTPPTMTAVFVPERHPIGSMNKEPAIGEAGYGGPATVTIKNLHEGREPHPKYGKPLSGAPRVLGHGCKWYVSGETFRPYSLGAGRGSVWISDDFRIELWKPRIGETYRVIVDGAGLGKKFRSEKTAIHAGLARRADIDHPAREPRFFIK